MAQRKSDLIEEIDSLRSQVRQLERSVSEAQASDKAAQAKAASYEAQVTELKDANATLMANLGSFANVSNKKEDALSKALESLNAKERQLKGIEDSFSANDSTIIVLLNDAKRTLGPDAKLKVAAGSLVISGGLSSLFGSDRRNRADSGREYLGRARSRACQGASQPRHHRGRFVHDWRHDPGGQSGHRCNECVARHLRSFGIPITESCARWKFQRRCRYPFTSELPPVLSNGKGRGKEIICAGVPG